MERQMSNTANLYILGTCRVAVISRQNALRHVPCIDRLGAKLTKTSWQVIDEAYVDHGVVKRFNHFYNTILE